MRTISTSLERTHDINTASASKPPRSAFILNVELLEQVGKGFLMARVQDTSSYGSSIDLVGCGSRQKTTEAVWQCEGVRLTSKLGNASAKPAALYNY